MLSIQHLHVQTDIHVDPSPIMGFKVDITWGEYGRFVAEVMYMCEFCVDEKTSCPTHGHVKCFHLSIFIRNRLTCGVYSCVTSTVCQYVCQHKT